MLCQSQPTNLHPDKYVLPYSTQRNLNPHSFWLSIKNSSDQALGTFCADPNQGGNCVIVDIKEAGACIDITTTLNPKVNGVSSFVPSNNGFCLMFTCVPCSFDCRISLSPRALSFRGRLTMTMCSASQCSGDLWELGTSLLNFSLLTFNGISPDNAIFTVVCIQM